MAFKLADFESVILILAFNNTCLIFTLETSLPLHLIYDKYQTLILLLNMTLNLNYYSVVTNSCQMTSGVKETKCPVVWKIHPNLCGTVNSHPA